MRFMNEIIKDIEDLRNNRTGEQHGYFTISGEPTDDDFVVDVLDICRALAGYEVDYNLADENELPDDKDKYGWELYNDYAERYVQYLINMGYIEDWDSAKGDNSYNWGSPVSNAVNLHMFKSLIDNSVYILFKVHRFGDVRCNYTVNCLLHFDDDYEFYEAINPEYKIIEVDGKEYEIRLDFFSEGFEVEDWDYNYIGTIYSYDKEEAINDIRDLVTANV